VVDVVSARDEGAVAGLCARNDVDLVAVHSPPFLHLRHVQMAAESGRRALLCDKPFGRDAREAAAMHDLARQAGLLAMVNYQFRYSPARVRLRELVKGGEVGRAEQVQSTTYLAVTRVPLRPFGWLFDADLGGGWIGAGGSHTVDFLRWILGDVEQSWTRTRTSVPERPDAEGRLQACTAEDGFTTLLQFRDGVTATIDSSFAAPVSLENRTTVFGTAAIIEMLGENTLVVRQAGEVKELDFGGPDPHLAFRRWAGVVRDSVLNGEVVDGAPTFAEGLACAQVLDRMRGAGRDMTTVSSGSVQSANTCERSEG
jgi:predicted dehydrogenase